MLIYIEKLINLKLKKRKQSNLFARVLLLPEQNGSTTKIQKSSNPEWNEGFQFDNLSFEELKNHHVLEISVWNYDGIECSELVGCILLGSLPDESKRNSWIYFTKQECDIWMNVLTHPGEWIKSCLTLRPSIVNRLEHQMNRDNSIIQEKEVSH